MNSRSIHSNISRTVALALMVLSSVAVVRAGDIVGQVVDAGSGSFLTGATVVLSGTDRSTTTDREGRFRFGNVDPGNVAVQVNYIGYDTEIETVAVPETGSVSVAISVGEDVVTMGELVVEGYREGRAKALQQKRSADLVMDIISADSVGNLPDRNVAEALARVAGISLDVVSGEGEGRFVSIRGIEPNFNNVTLNGSTMAAPSAGGREGRATPLDVVSSSQIAQIEVIKSVTPDMDGNALGGTVNIKTVSAFDRPERFIYGSAELGKNSEADDKQYQGEFTFGNTFNDGRLGVAVSANYSKRPYVSHDTQGNWNQDNSGRWFMSTLELQPAFGEKTRQGLDFNIELRPSDGVEWYLRGLYNKFDQEQREQEFILESRRDPVFVGPAFVTFDRMRFEQRDFQRKIDQTLANVTAGGKFRVGEFTYEGDVTYSRAKEDVPFIKSVQFRTGNVNMPAGRPFELDFGSFLPAYNDQGMAAGDPSIYPLRRYRDENSASDEETWSPRFDVRKDFSDMFGGRSGYLKTGVKYTKRNRFVDDNSERPVNGSLTMADIAPPGPGFAFQDGRYIYPSELDASVAFDYLLANRSQFDVDETESAENSTQDDYDITEKILGLYAMASVDVGRNVTVLGGLRYEDTDATLSGPELQTLDGDLLEVVTNTSDFSYGNLLPNLQVHWRMSERSLLRFAVTGTIGRPQYEKAAPKSVLEIEENESADDPDIILRSGSLMIGNPELSPYESLNLDLAYEYYLRSGGLLSVGVFRKEIDNPIYQFEQNDRNVTYNDFFLDSLTTRKELNADSATVTGLEVNVQLPFSTFIQTGFLQGFGVEGNATFIDSKTDIFERPGQDLPFFRQPDRIYNAALYFQNYGFSARVAFNYQSESLRTLGDDEDGTDDTWDEPREFTDIQASYKVSENFTVYLNWQNVFKARADRTLGHDTGRMRRSEFYGSYLRGGVRFRF